LAGAADGFVRAPNTRPADNGMPKADAEHVRVWYCLRIMGADDRLKCRMRQIAGQTS
jgi:hypothetical protein